jgi:hypothetical protein
MRCTAQQRATLCSRVYEERKNDVHRVVLLHARSLHAAEALPPAWLTTTCSGVLDPAHHVVPILCRARVSDGWQGPSQCTMHHGYRRSRGSGSVDGPGTQ